MSRQIDYRSSSQHSADDVAAVMLDEEYLRARLVQLGGPGAKVLAHEPTADGGRYTIRHGVDQAALPSIVSSLVSGNLVIQRTESLRREAPGRWAGDVDVQIPGTPASAVGSLALHDAGTGSELLVRADVTVKIPFLGGKIEAVIVDQVQQLLAAETAFTLEWLAGKHR
ncbi:DUF2505 domain-containing protein [Pseudonocardia abyssalis]|jgi:hypothetical protein|uniref:DUF2505 domain-containing protein n=1 Tax=Pseudonocardia abyssalis TaxID=2792008 RepID=A0ABS6UX00_9PSEU|nr:DUF2505 domain-containing protein [Pseudonocardia abyssalis]MBW0115196.1 DUF2505 domain-containing protein [Pseudonocardia abyssalis]MBW0136771.1 DUF2505 domain-containing protein [Pseudonocardia abyssalis]